jgi:hypothetical protein
LYPAQWWNPPPSQTRGQNGNKQHPDSVSDATNLHPDDIDLHITAPGRDEEVEGWKEVFGIEERYKAKLCEKNDDKAWLQNITEEADNVNLTSDQLLAMVLRAADRSPYYSANFLKKPFLTACKNAQII